MIVKGAGESLRKKMTDAARAKVRLRQESCFATEFPAAQGREGYRVTGSMLCRILRRSAFRVIADRNVQKKKAAWAAFL
jgi:hypothetical protein